MVFNNESKLFRWSLELHNLWIAPVPCSQYVCVQFGCGLRVATSSYFGFCSNSWPIFPRMLVSARTWNSKADSEEAISRLYIRFRVYTKVSGRPNMHAPGTQKKAPLWLWLRLAKGLPDLFNRLGTSFGWCIPQETDKVSQQGRLGYPRIISDSALHHQVPGKSVSGQQWKCCVHGPMNGQPQSLSPVPWLLVDVRQQS